MDNILGKRIRATRDKKNIKQNELAKVLGVTPYQLSRYETGKTKHDHDLIADIADHLEVTTDYLLGRTDTPESFQYLQASGRANRRLDYYKDKIATEYPDVDLMFKDLESFTAEEMKEVYEYIKFKKSQKK